MKWLVVEAAGAGASGNDTPAKAADRQARAIALKQECDRIQQDLVGAMEAEAARNESSDPERMEEALAAGEQSAPEPESESRAETTEDGWIDGKLPDFIAGLALWATPEQTQALCLRGGGMTLSVDAFGNEIPINAVGEGDKMVCGPPPIDPFETVNETRGVVAKYCELDGEPVACQLTFAMRDEGYEATMELRRRLESKYGPGANYRPDFACADPVDQRRTFRRIWNFSQVMNGRPFPTGRIVVGYMCVAEAPEEGPGLLLVYQNTLEILRRVEATKRRQDSF